MFAVYDGWLRPWPFRPHAASCRNCDGAVGAALVRHAAELLSRRLLEHLNAQLKRSVGAKLAGAALAGAATRRARASSSSATQSVWPIREATQSDV